MGVALICQKVLTEYWAYLRNEVKYSSSVPLNHLFRIVLTRDLYLGCSLLVNISFLFL